MYGHLTGCFNMQLKTVCHLVAAVERTIHWLICYFEKVVDLVTWNADLLCERRKPSVRLIARFIYNIYLGYSV